MITRDVEAFEGWIRLHKLPSHFWSEATIKWMISKFGRVTEVGNSIRLDKDHELTLIKIACRRRGIIPEVIGATCRDREFKMRVEILES